MKINFYFILIFLFFGSVVNAQDTDAPLKGETTENYSERANTLIMVNELTENKIVMLDELDIKMSLARLESDIKLYYKRQKKISNISLVFPKMNLEALA
ncbi:hypothetical protein Q4566_02580 [Tamlana sp. 2_MG-2023]|uniref:hypothetical protein n=1 Tax=unclassified Tamlana TaxID=2614803 RepID=UPI0026E15143|nr:MULTISPECIES: hypothetical protein [unclassified Tamlana]MDO6759074.1 hypothetical protein [Tamlana sp. 2_MG-2023]MDO6789773.1 hypothetical protein [Tamlana sp. 1_MG-2023]